MDKEIGKFYFERPTNVSYQRPEKVEVVIIKYTLTEAEHDFLKNGVDAMIQNITPEKQAKFDAHGLKTPKIRSLPTYGKRVTATMLQNGDKYILTRTSLEPNLELLIELGDFPIFTSSAL